MPAETTTESGVTCARCGHVNPRSARNHCRKCDAHLRVTCRFCGRGNERTAAVCSGCGGQLHHTGWRRLAWRAHRRFGLAGFAVVLVAVLLLAWSAAFLSAAARRAKSPSPPPEKPGPEELVKKYRR